MAGQDACDVGCDIFEIEFVYMEEIKCKKLHMCICRNIEASNRVHSQAFAKPPMIMDTANTVYVVTGANRGLGLGLTRRLLERPATTIVASVRNQNAALSLMSEVESVVVGKNSVLHVIELDFSTAISPEEITQAFTAAVSTVTHIDVLICNAGFATPMTPALVTSAEDLRKSFEVNTIAPLLVFQAFWPLMQRSASAPKLAVISSSVGSIADQEPVPGGAYGPSKAASNWLTKALHVENEADGLIAFALHPGWVQTRAGDFAAKEWGYPGRPPVTVEDSVKGMLGVIDTATRENVSGKFISQTGDILSW
ncbi:unnamed protein product [Penicillium glandicola]